MEFLFILQGMNQQLKLLTLIVKELYNNENPLTNEKKEKILGKVQKEEFVEFQQSVDKYIEKNLQVTNKIQSNNKDETAQQNQSGKFNIYVIRIV